MTKGFSTTRRTKGKQILMLVLFYTKTKSIATVLHAVWAVATKHKALNVSAVKIHAVCTHVFVPAVCHNSFALQQLSG